MAKLAYEQRVANGVKFLNKNVPGWFNKIDLKLFDLGSPSMCVLGQVYGDFMDAVRDITTVPVKKRPEYKALLKAAVAYDKAHKDGRYDDWNGMLAEQLEAFFEKDSGCVELTRAQEKWSEDHGFNRADDDKGGTTQQLAHLWQAEIAKRQQAFKQRLRPKVAKRKVR